jgi:hypothetical protein
MLRQKGIEVKLIQLAQQVAALMTPGIPASDKAKEIAKLNAFAITQTTDSGAIPVPVSPFVFSHGLTYTPSVNLIIMHRQSGDIPFISDINDTTVTITCATNTFSPTIIRIICH